MLPLDVFIPALVSFLLFLNSLPGEFCYDDSRAIKRNPDVLGETSLWAMFSNDFWGTPLLHSGSHKSFRPLCTITFRLNHALTGLLPFGFHAFNVLLHSVTTALYTATLKRLLDCRRVSFLAGLLFATHPVHAEAVSGIVGRADVLACFFFLLAFNCYTKYCSSRDADVYFKDDDKTSVTNGTKHAPAEAICQRHVQQTLDSTAAGKNRVDENEFNLLKKRLIVTTWMNVIGFVSFVMCAMLSKEQGVTVVFVCTVYDIFIRNKLTVYQLHRIFFDKRFRRLLSGIMLNLGVCIGFVLLRLYLIGMSPPHFSPSDNPASDSDSFLTRCLTFVYLPVVNFGLLLCPLTLSFDWSMDAIELVRSFSDLRNCISLVFYFFLFLFVTKVIFSVNAAAVSNALDRFSKTFLNGCGSDHVTTNNGLQTSHGINNSSKSCSHLFMSSSSSSLQNLKLTNILKTSSCRHHKPSPNVSLPIFHSIHLSNDADQLNRWHSALLGLSLLIFPFIPASNLFFYVGFVVAERVLYIPSMGFCLIVALGVHLLLNRLERRPTICPDEAKKTALIGTGLKDAIGDLSHGVSTSRQRAVIICVFVLLLVAFSCRTYSRNEDWLTEESLYKSGIPVNPAKAWGNLANVLNAAGKVKEAERAYKTALVYRSNMADVHYNLGILYQEQGKSSEAIQSYERAIQCRPRLTMAHLNLGIVLASVGRKLQAEQVYRHCSEIDTTGLKDPRLHEHTKISALYNLGRLLADADRHEEAVRVYLKAIDRKPAQYPSQSIYNMLGESYARLEQLESAEFNYKMALQVKPDHVPAHLTLAKLYHRQGLLEEAEKLYTKARILDPSDHSIHQHYGQFLSETGRLMEAVDSYMEAARLAPHDFEVVFNSANALRSVGKNSEAEGFYRKATELQPETALTHMNLGAMLHYNGKLEDAERSYLRALELKPGDAVTTSNLNKLRSLLERKHNKRTR